MDSSFAETIPNATIDTTLSEPQFEFQEIDQLQNLGINAADLNKLKAAGILTIKGVKMMTKKKLSDIKGISDAKVDKIKEAVKKMTQNDEFITGMEYSTQRQVIFKISTGSSEVDKILGGGIESMSITEVFGEFRTGKTQIAHTICVTSQIPGIGHQGGKVIFIDTENTFRPDRLRPIAERFNLDADTVLNNIVYARAHSSEHQTELIDNIAALLFQEPGVYRTLIIDSIIALFRVDYQGRGELSMRQQSLSLLLSKLQKLSEEFNLAIYITNQMTSDPGAQMSFVSDPKKPVGGNILAHASQTRVMLKKGRQEMRVAKIYDSPDMPEAEAAFAITNGGIRDAEE